MARTRQLPSSCNGSVHAHASHMEEIESNMKCGGGVLLFRGYKKIKQRHNEQRGKKNKIIMNGDPELAWRIGSREIAKTQHLRECCCTRFIFWTWPVFQYPIKYAREG